MTDPDTTRGPGAVASMAIASVFFFAMTVAVKSAHGIPTVQIVFFRAFVALILSLAQLRWEGVSVFGVHRGLLFLRGVFGSMALVCYFWSIGQLPLAIATVLQSLAPVFTAGLAVAVLGERMRPVQVLLFGLAAAGVFVMRGGGEGGTLFGVVVGLGGAFFAACAYTVIGRIGRREHPLVVVLWFPLVTVPVMAPVLPFVWVWPDTRQWVALLAVGLFVQVAQVFMTRAYQLGPTSIVSLVSYLGLVWAALGGLLWFDEPLTAPLLAGTGLILLGVIGTSRLRPRPSSAPLPPTDPALPPPPATPRTTPR